MSPYDSDDLDELLSDVRRLLGEDGADGGDVSPEEPAAPSHRAVSDETQQYTPIHMPQQSKPVPPWERPDFAGEYFGPENRAPVVRSASARAARPVQTPNGGRQPQPNPSAAPPQSRSDAQRAVRRAQGPMSARQMFEGEDDDEDEEDDELYERPGKKRKGRWIKRLFILLLILLVLAAVVALVSKLIATQPVYDGADSLGARKTGSSTILLIGTDEGGTRTDTLMLLNVNTGTKQVSLVSIPRDTRVNGSYSVPKINGVYGINGGGEEGMEMLQQRVKESIGFWPDGYILVNLDSFVDLVDIMGGVTFNVPQDMYYNDPSQNLYIDLKAGEQKLNGTEAMGLVRFRSGYATADLGRVDVQRDFVSAAAKQWLNPMLVFKTPQLITWLGGNVETDLGVKELSWLAWAMLRCDLDNIQTETLPGTATTISGGSYYLLDPYTVPDTVNRCINPYERDITVDDLYIRGY
ncbi:LCP family glycopolymer transferase [Candidatus Avoscillospira sp. LCP25S3_F1]|uniref:LCP family protein n=1 Tax=Candidatus Avoscillospira sp. LCP25S3_F1 TaxID=3438825 RepID=UPI003F92D280